MTDEPKQRRTYRSRVREERAADTRTAVIAAARQLFVSLGWHGTTIAGVARQAGVSAETVYVSFGNKPQLLRAVIEATVRREDPQTPLLQQPGPRAVAEAPDQATALHRFAHDITAVLAGVADIVAVLRVAAETDAELAAMYEGVHRGRRDNLALLARALATKGVLREGVGEADVLAEVWRLASPELFLLMRKVEGLSPEQYAAWLERTLGRLVLPTA